MIPIRSSRPPVLASPGMSQMDLAKLIHRTVQLAVDAKRELGFAAVNVGCDGRKRTTMFDGSTCQTEGEVCLAERQDGITTCLNTPAQGNGLTFERVTFVAPVCSPVTGWWIVDAKGYMYRVPQALIDAAPYWPPTGPGVSSEVTLLRAKTWASLMCGADLAVTLNGEGGAIWYVSGEIGWVQSFAAAIGGLPDSWLDEDEVPIVGIGLLPVPGFVLDMPSARGVLLRDQMAPNAGSRVVTVTLPTAVSGVVTGAVRVAYGYAFGSVIAEAAYSTPSSLAPYPRDEDVGTWQADCVGRRAGDMALVYRLGLGVEYATGHICLDGTAITDPSDYVSAAELAEASGPARDVAAGLIACPNGEVALLGPADVRTGQRYRIRPAPSDPVTVAIERLALGSWDDDPNAWVQETVYTVDPWLAGATQFTISGIDASAPGRTVNIILWETDGSDESYVTAPVAYVGALGQTSGGLTTLAFSGAVAASSYAHRYLTIVGVHLHATWGWTFEVGGVESALSILSDGGVYGYDLSPATVTYSIKISIPAGPTGATARHLYRLAWDYGSSTTGIVSPVGPWSYLGNPGGGWGGAYDRMVRRIASFDGGAAVDYYDIDTSLSLAGTRPPSPLIPTGSITIAAPLPVHLLQPMNL